MIKYMNNYSDPSFKKCKDLHNHFLQISDLPLEWDQKKYKNKEFIQDFTYMIRFKYYPKLRRKSMILKNLNYLKKLQKLRLYNNLTLMFKI